MYSEQEQNSILTANASQTCKNETAVRRLRRHDTQNLVKTKQIAKEHSKSQNEQHIIESYQNNRPVNLHVQDANKTCGLSHASIILVSSFTRLFESTINKHIPWYTLGRSDGWTKNTEDRLGTAPRNLSSPANLFKALKRNANCQSSMITESAAVTWAGIWTFCYSKE